MINIRVLLMVMSALSASGCSTLGPSNPARSAVPFPMDYETRVADSFLTIGEAAQITVPRQVPAWSLRDADDWLVCLRRSDGSVTSIFLGRFGIDGTITGAKPFCHGQIETHAIRWSH